MNNFYINQKRAEQVRTEQIKAQSLKNPFGFANEKIYQLATTTLQNNTFDDYFKSFENGITKR